MVVCPIDTRRIHDWESFHDVFAERLGFPNFYGRNLDAWIDCLTYLDEPEAAMTSLHVAPGEVLVLELEHAGDFARRCPEQYEATIECAASVNWRRIQLNQPALLALAFYKSEFPSA